MRVLEQGQLKGDFEGFNDETTVFEFLSGSAWRQTRVQYWYHYAHMPRAKVFERDGRRYFQVEGTDNTVEVVRVRR